MPAFIVIIQRGIEIFGLSITAGSPAVDDAVKDIVHCNLGDCGRRALRRENEDVMHAKHDSEPACAGAAR